ncbi:GtrA family protein [Cellulomonas fengjieae]|uniref:GtrA family protein n=1 Tax=Cellulomonas fengjieae TaxID=2819978 RepID=A0ABS3SDV1_9CELL|nr:GtrA family protein [Cellulomonas fengjieae]MBO3083822.1 GtrA family protein [Cellulomonas fengjieae]QVI64890.1 GtrA family protein [Cellulomonas fengjieae]
MSASDRLTDRVVVTTPVAPAARTAALRARAYELGRFLSVGGLAFVVDLGLFNLLRFGPGQVLEHKPLTANVIAIVAATLVSWLGNRHWTFSRQRTDERVRELTVFAAINIVCAVIPVLTLAFSHYALDLTTPLADNVAKVLGIAIGTVLRYLGYKRWVFTGLRTSV